MATVRSLIAREIEDSRGAPAIEVELVTDDGRGIASVPSGASVGAHEALELRDGDPSKHGGKGVTKAIAQVGDVIAPAVIGREFDQQTLDAFVCELDGTANKSRLGANAILGVSIAFARAAAEEQGQPLYAYLGSLGGRTSYVLPQPLFNVINGGKHAARGIDIQETMLAPIGFSNMHEKVAAVMNTVGALQALLTEKGYDAPLGDEGGFAPALGSDEEALDLLVAAVNRAGYASGQMKIAFDAAATSWYADGRYTLRSGGEREMTRAMLLEWYAHMANVYPLISIEDGFAEDDWEGFASLTETLGSRLSVVGDDLTVTNVARIETAIGKKAANACIIKPNQVGTVTEAIAAVRTARAAGWKIFASHRSGETMDAFIADFAVGLSADYLKAGAPTKKERMVKYTRLMEIEQELSHI